MSPKTVIGVTGFIENNLTEEEVEAALEDTDADSLEEFSKEQEEAIESIIVNRVFGEADSIVIMNVVVEVEE